MKKIKILIADDHPLFLDGLKTLIRKVPEFVIVAVASNGAAVLELLKKMEVDVVLLDIEMPVMNGIEAAQKITEEFPALKILALTTHSEKGMVMGMLNAGASGYVLKNAGKNELVEAITKVASGKRYFSPDATLALSEKESTAVKAGSTGLDAIEITAREREILKLIAEGLSSREIGKKLFISPRTVDTHRTNLMLKLEVKNISGLVYYAMKHGFIS